MKDVLEEGGPTLRPLPVLALLATAVLSIAILYNAFLGQVDGAGRRNFVASQETDGGASTRVDVMASNSRNATIVLKLTRALKRFSAPCWQPAITAAWLTALPARTPAWPLPPIRNLPAFG